MGKVAWVDERSRGGRRREPVNGIRACKAFHELNKKLGWSRGGIGDVQFTGDERLKFEKWMTAHNYKLDDQEGMQHYLLEWPRSRAALEHLQSHPGMSTAAAALYWAKHVERPGKKAYGARIGEAQRLHGLDPDVRKHGTMHHQVHGAATMNIKLAGFPSGTRTDLKTDGDLFKEVKLDRGRAMPLRGDA